MSTTTERGPSELYGFEEGRCNQCGGQARLWSDRWYCTQCGYFDLNRSENKGYRDNFGDWKETETFDALVEKAHFWARHSMGTSGAGKTEALGHAAICMSRAMRLLATQLRQK